MTFYEAALRILESEGRPLHFLEITEKSIAQNLLSHIGKTPEKTMLSRLAAMARRTRDRRVVVTAKDTFALIDWAIPEDLEALAQTGLPEPHPEEGVPPLRPVERHPEPRVENARVLGRGSERKRRREDEEERGRRRRFPPVADVVFEILSEGTPSLRPEEVIAQARGRELAGDELTPEQLLTALVEDNQRRIDAGRRPQFVLSRETGQLSLERPGSEVPPGEIQAALAATLGIPMENGRPMLARPAAPAAPAEVAPEAATTLVIKNAVKEARRALAKGLRQKLASLDGGTFEKSVVRMMQALGFRELKVAKRSKDGPLLTTRRREGSVELRFAVRMLKGSPSLDRKAVQDLRRDLGHYSAQVGLLVSAGEVRGDARSEAQSSGSLVMLWCGDALAEKFMEARTAVTVTQVELFELDEKFFEAARLDAEEAQRRREERQKEKAQREEKERPAERAAAESTAAPVPGPAPTPAEAPAGSVQDEEAAVAAPEAAQPEQAAAEVGAEGAEGAEAEGDGEGDDEGEEGAAPADAAAPGTPGQFVAQPTGERKRRRRRRRGRRGRGQRPAEGAQAVAAAGGAPAGGPAEPVSPGVPGPGPVQEEAPSAAPPPRLVPPEGPPTEGGASS